MVFSKRFHFFNFRRSIRCIAPRSSLENTKNKLIDNATMDMMMNDDINEIHVFVGKMLLAP